MLLEISLQPAFENNWFFLILLIFQVCEGRWKAKQGGCPHGSQMSRVCITVLFVKGPGVTQLLSIACCRKSDLVTLKCYYMCAHFDNTLYIIYIIYYESMYCIYLCTCIRIRPSDCLMKFSHLKICILSHHTVLLTHHGGSIQ